MNMRRTYLPDLAGIWGLVVFITLSVVAGNKALQDGDTLWHIKMGQVMLERGELLKHDIFSHTAYGQPWHAHEWLSEIIMAILYKGAGLPGVTIFYFAVTGLTITLILKIACRLAGDGPPILATVLALPCIYIHLLARPHIFTWFGAALTLYLLERRGRWLLLLIPLTTVWANLHGGVLFGLAVQVIFIVGNLLDHIQTHSALRLRTWWEESRKTIFLLGLCILATCFNPFGYQIFIYPLKVASPIFAQGISEWKAPDFQLLWFARIWVISILFMTMWMGKRLSWKWLLLVLFLLWQTLGHVRHLSIAALLLVPCMAIFVKEICGFLKFRDKKNSDAEELVLSPWTGPTLIALILLSMLGSTWINLFDINERIKDNFKPKKSYFTVIDYLESGYPSSNLLNDYEWGDYLLFGLDLPPKVFIDGRADMYGEKIFSDYSKMARFEKEADDLLIKYKIGWTLFPIDNVLSRYLEKCKSWRNIYQDEFIIILEKPISN